MKRTRNHVVWSVVAGLVIFCNVAETLKGTALVISKLKGKTEPTPHLAESRSSDEEHGSASNGEGAGDSLPLSALGNDAANATTKPPLTGIPQIDYIHDPNLPRELNGYNLTDYPFYDRVPDDINFKCDGLHDGFYASIPHKCQVYHHCLFGTRYDFLCANYTAFDQKTFICHFVSEVDCVNSPKYFKRNEALYKEATTTTVATTTAATTPPPPPPARRPQPGGPAGGRRRRPHRKYRPVYDYYYDDYEDDTEYYDDELPTRSGAAHAPASAGGRRRKRPRPQRPVEDDSRTSVSAPSGPSVPVVPLEQPDVQPEADTRSRPSASVYERPRVPPKVRRPVPANERDKYEYTTRRPAGGAAEEPSRPKQAARPVETDSDYYDYEEDYVPPARSSQSATSRGKHNDYYPPSAPEDRDVVRRPVMSGSGRPLRRNRPAGSGRRRPESTTSYAPLPLEDEGDDYDETYEQDRRRPVRPAGGRKRPQELHRPPPQPARAEPEYTQSQRPYVRAQPTRYDEEEDFVEEPVPAPRPAYISTAPGGTSTRQTYRKRVHQQPETDDYLPARSGVTDSSGYRRPAAAHRKHPPPARQTSYADDEDYYDDEVSEETPQSSYRPKQPPRNSGGRVQSVNPSPAPPPLPPAPARTSQVEDDDIIVSPERTSSGKRPFLPSRGGNPTLPRGLQPLGAKATQQTSQSDIPVVDIVNDRSVKISQPLSTTSYRPKLEVPEEAPLRQSSAQKVPNPPALSEALTSRPLVQSNFKPGGNRPSHIDSLEEEIPPRRVTNSDYRSKVYEETQPRIPPSGAGNFKNKQTAPTSSISDSISRTPINNGKYKPNIPETVSRNPSSTSLGFSSSNYKPKADEISLATAKTSPPLLNVRDESSRQPTGSQKTYNINEDYRSLPSTSNAKQGTSTAYRTPAKSPPKPSTAPPPKIPDLPPKNNLADIDESEYDVTLNDALHPTLHPTRSVATGIVSFPQQQTTSYRVQVFKTKIGSPSSSTSLSSSSSSRRGAESYSNDASSSLTGGRGQLVASGSQRQVTRAPYASLSVHTKDPSPVVVETGPRDYNPDDTVQLTRKRRPQIQYQDEITPRVPARYTQADRYQRGIADYDSFQDEVSYSPERQRQNWRRDPSVEHTSHY